MDPKFLALACILAIVQVHGIEVNNQGRIKITTVTTSGCYDTVLFIGEQLAEAYRLYGNYLDIEFIPWGRTTWDGVGDMVCQFGAPDCWANRVHRCALNILSENQAAQVDYMTCEFSLPYPSFSQGTYACAQQAGINLIELDHCVANNNDDLDRAAQTAAAAPMAAIDFVPAIVFNDAINLSYHSTARTRLASMICFALAEVPGSGVTSCQI